MKTQRIKILFTIPNFDTAGSGKVLYDLAHGLNKTLFEVHIACSHDQGFFFKEVQALGLPIHLIDTSCALRPYFSLFKRIHPYKQFIKTHGFDLVHSWHWSSDWTEVLGAKWGGAQFVYTKKAMSWGNRHWHIRSWLADYIITINSDMRSFFPWKREQQLIPLGLDLDYYCQEQPLKSASPHPFRIITVANLVPVKGIEVLLEAVYLLKEEGSPILLEVLGDDGSSYADTLKADVVSKGLEEEVVFLGKQSDVRPYLSHADLYVIPTLDSGRKEGMPMALVEAMSMAVPVLGSDITGINFVLQGFPELLFKAGDSEGLTFQIKRIMALSDIERRKLGFQLRQYVATHFSLNAFIKAHEDLYLELTN